ncbi:MAG: hypothetical protein HC936_11995 [Leptolyngbyaceae cyanobacterium SU_3_3]|nr:hypothetical protein [Leptolyngbyaceae cyanobacterium SU_3_3]
MGSLLLYLLVPELRARFNPILPPISLPSISLPSASPVAPANSPAPNATASISPSPSATTSLAPSPLLEPFLEVGSFLQVAPRSTPNSTPIDLLSLPGSPIDSTPDPGVGQIPNGSILQVVGKQTMTDRRSWLRLKVCSVANNSGSASGSKFVRAGDVGWLEAKIMTGAIAQNFSIKPTQLGSCANSTP